MKPPSLTTNNQEMKLTLILLLSLATALSSSSSAQQIKSARLLDLVIRDYTFRSYTKNFKTGKLHRIILPSNLSAGITVDTIRFRCGSLRRYGAKIKEFSINTGVDIHPRTKRVMLVRQTLNPAQWSSLYYNNYDDLSGYQLVSPVLGLLAYNVLNSSEVRIRTTEKPIIIDFRNTTLVVVNKSLELIPLCARFDEDGKVTLWRQVRPNVCVATREGHFGLVVESPLMPLKRRRRRRRVSKWKMAVGGAMGAALGGFLLSLLAVAVLVKVKRKKKKEMEEMERMAYEEEALSVSMVGHVRALTASATRTLPTIEHHEYRPPLAGSNSNF